MKYIHPYKKVVLWENFWKDCKERKLGFCKIMDEGKDKICRPNDITKDKCPLWAKLDDLIVFKNNYSNDNSGHSNSNGNKYPIKRRSSSYHGKKREKSISRTEKGFFED